MFSVQKELEMYLVVLFLFDLFQIQRKKDQDFIATNYLNMDFFFAVLDSTGRDIPLMPLLA